MDNYDCILCATGYCPTHGPRLFPKPAPPPEPYPLPPPIISRPWGVDK